MQSKLTAKKLAVRRLSVAETKRFHKAIISSRTPKGQKKEKGKVRNKQGRRNQHCNKIYSPFASFFAFYTCFASGLYFVHKSFPYIANRILSFLSAYLQLYHLFWLFFKLFTLFHSIGFFPPCSRFVLHASFFSIFAYAWSYLNSCFTNVVFKTFFPVCSLSGLLLFGPLVFYLFLLALFAI